MISTITISASPSTTVAVTSSTTCPVSTEERLLALIVHTQSKQCSAAETSVQLDFERIERLRGEVSQALEQAREAKKDAGFWNDLSKIFGSDVAKLATAVAAVAAAVATCGAAAAALAVIAASASIAAEHAEELGISPEVAMAIGVAAGAASLCYGNATGAFDVSKGAVSLVAGDAQAYANAVAGGAKAAGGASHAIAGKYEADAGHRQADARSADGWQDVVSADIDEAIDRLHAALEQQAAAVRIASDIVQQRAASQLFILSNGQGAA